MNKPDTLQNLTLGKVENITIRYVYRSIQYTQTYQSSHVQARSGDDIVLPMQLDRVRPIRVVSGIKLKVDVSEKYDTMYLTHHSGGITKGKHNEYI